MEIVIHIHILSILLRGDIVCLCVCVWGGGGGGGGVGRYPPISLLTSLLISLLPPHLPPISSTGHCQTWTKMAACH